MNVLDPSLWFETKGSNNSPMCMKWHYSSLRSFNLLKLIPPLCQNPKMTFKLTCRFSNYKCKLYHILFSSLSNKPQTEHLRNNNTSAFVFSCSLFSSTHLLSFLSSGGEVWQHWAACGRHQRSSFVWFRGQIRLYFVQFNCNGQPWHARSLYTQGLVSCGVFSYTYVTKHIHRIIHTLYSRHRHPFTLSHKTLHG